MTETATRGGDGRLGIAVLLALAGAVLLVYLPSLAFPLVRYDDEALMLDIPVVRQGLTWESAKWAFSTDKDAGRIPLTWLSRLLDVSLFGDDARGYHLVNVLLHGANASLLFLALRRMTRRPWESAFAAALFAVHPLHVESVAWVTERKDVLMGFFWMLGLLSYARYAERPGAGRYLAVAACFALSLMSKPAAVTFPFALLLLDHWPLGRLRPGGGGGGEGAPGGAGEEPRFAPAPFSSLLREKAPLLLLSAAAALVTLLDEGAGRDVPSLTDIPLRLRLLNGLVSYAKYLGKAFWPASLSPFYPHRGEAIGWAAPAAAALLLAALTLLVLRERRRLPCLAVGWFWFLGVLVPVIGVVQAGEFAMADRCAYLPMVGIYAAASFGGSALLSRVSLPRPAVAALCAAVLLALAHRASAQVMVWQDTGTLFRHAVAVTEGNWMAHSALGVEAFRARRFDEAFRHYGESLRIQHGNRDARYSLYSALSLLGRREEAMVHFRENLRTSRARPEELLAIGLSFAADGKLEEAEACFRAAVDRDPSLAEGHYHLAVALGRLGRRDEALGHFRLSLVGEAKDADGHNRLGVALLRLGRADEAARRFEEALRLAPGHDDATFNLSAARKALAGEGGR